MIAIFHSLPQIDELKRNYLFFDELQTSEKFVKNNLEIVLAKSRHAATKEFVNAMLRTFDDLVDKGIIRPNEDIEQRLIPDIGGFDVVFMERTLSQYDAGELNVNRSLMNFFWNVRKVREKFGVNIIGERLVSMLVPVYQTRFYQLIQRIAHSPEKLLSFINEFSSIYSRMAATVLNEHFLDNNYYPLIEGGAAIGNDFKMEAGLNFETTKQQVIHLVINKMPAPEESVSWERLIEFKADPDTARKLLGLRVWVSEISKKEMTMSEITDKLDYLLREYTDHFDKYKIKYQLTQLETILLPTLDILENLAKLKFSKVAETLFHLKNGQFELFTAEANFPGREVAYIHKVQNFFGQL